MNVLLCSPLGLVSEHVQGGIVVWAQSILDYYSSHPSDVHIQVTSFDRKTRTNAKGEDRLLKRAWFGVLDYSGAIRNARKQLESHHYDVLHLCTSASISLAKDILILKMARRKGVKTAVHFHFGRIPELEQQNNWEWKMIQRVARMADAVITMDLKSYRALEKHGFKNIHYLPNPLSLGIMEQILSLKATAVREDRKLCFAGHVIRTKGVFELVEACKGIEGIKLYVIGKVTPEVRGKLEEIADGSDWLVFEGEVDHQVVIQEMLSSGIFILPSYTEGFPNVILESMACGCAIVTTPVGAIPEMLDNASSSPCGLCCEPKDVEGLRSNIQFFLDHPEEARQYADRAVKRVNELYAIPTVWEQLVSIWKGVC